MKATNGRPTPVVTLRMSPPLLRRLASASPSREAVELMNAASAVARGGSYRADGTLTSEGMAYLVVYEPPETR